MPQNGDRIVAIDTVTSLHLMYKSRLTAKCLFVHLLFSSSAVVAYILACLVRICCFSLNGCFVVLLHLITARKSLTKLSLSQTACNQFQHRLLC